MADDFSAIMGADDTTVDDTSVQNETTEPDSSLEPTDAQAEKTAEPLEGDNRTLPQWIRNLKANDPEGFKAAKAEFFGRRAFAQEFPGGMDEVKSVKAFVAEHGGLEGAQQAFTDLQGKAQELDTIQERIANADAALLSDLPPETIGKLGPAFLAEYSKADFDGYNAQLSGIFAQTIAASEVPQVMQSSDFHFKMLANALNKAGITENPLYPMIAEAFENIFQGHTKLKEFTGGFKAAATPSAKQSGNPQLDAREQTIKQGEAAMRSNQFNNELERAKTPLIESEMKTWFAKAPGDEEKKDAAVSMLRERVSQALAKEQQEKGRNSTAEQVKSLMAKGDIANAVKIAKSRETILIRELAPKVGRIIYGAAETPKVEVKKDAPVVRATPRIAPTASRADKFSAIFESA